RTDLFSLGMTLWFLTEGRAPESGSSAEIAASRLNRENYAARLPTNLPLPFRDVLGRLLEKDRKNRFATAADLFNSLNACAPALDRFRVHIAQLMRLDVAEIVRPKAIKRYSDYVAVISDKPGGTDLLSVLRTERAVPLVEAAPLLEKIADVCDRLCAAGLPGAQLAPGRIFIERPNDGLSKAEARLYPRLLA